MPRFGVRRFTWRGVDVRGRRDRLHGGGRGRGGRPRRRRRRRCGRPSLAAGVVPAGLGARDTLRLEAALPLHGHELGPGITPLQAGLGWVVGWDKPDFRGRAALAAERDRGVARRLVGLATEGRQPPREGATVGGGRHGRSGTVTSGNFSPMLEHGIALALVDVAADGAPACRLELDQRGKARPRHGRGHAVRPARAVRRRPHDRVVGPPRPLVYRSPSDLS